MEITARFVKEQDGTIKAVGVAKDISKRKFIEEERNTLIRQLEEAVTERDNLLKENKASSLFQVGNFSVSLLVGAGSIGQIEGGILLPEVRPSSRLRPIYLKAR